MKDHNELTIGDCPVATLLSAELPGLLDAMLDRFVRELPFYARMPEEALDSDMRTTAKKVLALFIDSLTPDWTPPPEIVPLIAESAARRAEESVPMDEIVGAYHIATQLCLDRLLAVGGSALLPLFPELTRCALRFLHVVNTGIAAGYAQENQVQMDENAVASQQLLAALLDGSADDHIAARAGIRLSPCYWVVAIKAGPHPDEEVPGNERDVVIRRKWRRIHIELSRCVTGPILWTGTSEEALALLPYPTAVHSLSDADWRWLRQIIGSTERAAKASVTVAVAPAAPSGVAAAGRLAREVLDVVTASGRAPGIYTLRDVALDYQLSRPSPALPELAELVTPLRQHPELFATLRVFLSEDMNKRRTASLLHLHPNSIDYRLRRITGLIGVDAARSSNVPVLVAAIAALDHSDNADATGLSGS